MDIIYSLFKLISVLYANNYCIDLVSECYKRKSNANVHFNWIIVLWRHVHFLMWVYFVYVFHGYG